MENIIYKIIDFFIFYYKMKDFYTNTSQGLTILLSSYIIVGILTFSITLLIIKKGGK